MPQAIHVPNPGGLQQQQCGEEEATGITAAASSMAKTAAPPLVVSAAAPLQADIVEDALLLPAVGSGVDKNSPAVLPGTVGPVGLAWPGLARRMQETG